MEAEGITYHVPPGFGRFRFGASATLGLAGSYTVNPEPSALLRPDGRSPNPFTSPTRSALGTTLVPYSPEAEPGMYPQAQIGRYPQIITI